MIQPFETKTDIEREDAAYFALNQLGMTLLKSGKKPGTNETGYRVMSATRLNLTELEDLIASNERYAARRRGQ